MKWCRFVALAAALLGAVAAPARAQIEQGRLMGLVTDTSGGVLPGVTVTAKSPALIGSQSAVSETDGRYRFPSLPSGTYSLTFELAGFQTFTRQNIVLTIGTTLTVDGQMQVATLNESVTVTGESPVVDMATTKVGTDLTADKLASVPTATDMWSVVGQAQGVRMQGYDVGGGHKSQGIGFEAFGIKDSRQLIDGVDMTIGNYPDYFANEEVAVSAAGGDVEVTTPGATIIQTVKSGGNTFHGIENLAYEPGRFVGNNVDAATSARGFTGQPNLLFWEGHWDLGGPIVKDKLWFYTAYNHFHIDKAVSGVPQSVATDLGIFDDSTTKATYKAGAKDTLIGYFQYGKKQKPKRGLSTLVPPQSVLGQDSPYWTWKGQEQRVWSNRLFTDVRFGMFGFNWPMQPAVDAKTNPPRIDDATNQQQGAGWNAFSNQPYMPQIVANTTYYVPDKMGSHDLKVGFEYDLSVHRYAINGNSGPIRYHDLSGKPAQIEFVDVGANSDLGSTWKGADDRDTRIAGYAQDRWAPTNRLTLQLGLRYEMQNPHYETGVRAPLMTDILTAASGPLAGQPIFPTRTTAGRSLFTRNSFAPRLGINYDITGKGDTVVKGYYGRFYVFYDNAFAAANPGGANYRTFVFNDVNGNGLYDGPQELGALARSSGGIGTAFDPNIKLTYADEISGSIEHQFWGESSVRVGYVRKMLRNNYGTVNIARDGQFNVPVTVNVPMVNYNGSKAGQVVGQQSFNLLTIPSSLIGQVSNLIENVPDGWYNYDTLSFAFNKRFAGRVFVQSSFDYQWRNELRGGTTSAGAPVSLSTTPLDTDPINVGYFQNVNPAVSNRQKNTNWEGRLIGRYDFPHEFGIGANLRVQSGFNYARVITTSVPNLGTWSFFADNIDNLRSQTVPILDLRADKALTVGRYRIHGIFDVFNVANSNAINSFVITNGANYGKVIGALDPRTAQISVRFDF